jgi:hypothetical protein
LSAGFGSDGGPLAAASGNGGGLAAGRDAASGAGLFLAGFGPDAAACLRRGVLAAVGFAGIDGGGFFFDLREFDGDFDFDRRSAKSSPSILFDCFRNSVASALAPSSGTVTICLQAGQRNFLPTLSSRACSRWPLGQ